MKPLRIQALTLRGARRSTELSLYVHKDVRGKGIGARLLERTIEETRKQGERFHVIIGEYVSW